jgi:hypothetical protein
LWWGRGAVAFWVERKRKGKKVVMWRMAGGGWIFDGRKANPSEGRRVGGRLEVLESRDGLWQQH